MSEMKLSQKHNKKLQICIIHAQCLALFHCWAGSHIPTSTCGAKYLTQSMSACDSDFSYLSDVTVSLTYRTNSMLQIKIKKKTLIV